MDDHRFDDLARLLATTVPRRGLASGLAGGAIAVMLGAGVEDIAGKKRRKKKKKKSPCTPSCFNKVCGQDNGCGGACSVQAGCDSDEACVNGACAANVCDPACAGNTICQPNGSCACPPGLQECATGGFPGFCHECCINGSGGLPDPECIGTVGGPYCREDDGDLVNRCSCHPGQKACGGGICGLCCDTPDCFFDVFGEGQNIDSGRDCLVANQETGELTCQCQEGFSRCGTTSVCAGPDDDRLCGPECMDCTRFAGWVCQDERCCVPAFGSCLTPQDCCTGLTCIQQTAPPSAFVCA